MDHKQLILDDFFTCYRCKPRLATDPNRDAIFPELLGGK